MRANRLLGGLVGCVGFLAALNAEPAPTSPPANSGTAGPPHTNSLPLNPFRVAMGRVNTEIYDCVKSSVAAKSLPANFTGWDFVLVRFVTNGPPQVSISRASGIDALDKQTLDCTKGSPSLAEADQQKDGTRQEILAYPWYLLLRPNGPKPNP